MKNQPPARRDKARYELRWLLASLAGLLFLMAYIPKHPIHECKHAWQVLLKRMSRYSGNPTSTKG